MPRVVDPVEAVEDDVEEAEEAAHAVQPEYHCIGFQNYSVKSDEVAYAKLEPREMEAPKQEL